MSRSRCWPTGRLASRRDRPARRIAGALIAALLTTACAPRLEPPTPPAAPVLLALVTWNMDAGRGDLARLLTDLSSATLAGTRPPEYIALLQEAVETDVARLARTRNLHVAFSPVRVDAVPRRGNAIVSTLPLNGTRTIVLPRERQPRTAAAATIALEGHSLFIVSVHLENRVAWWRGGLISDAARGRQAEALLRALPAGAPGIVGGDMNTWLGPAEPAWRLLAQRFPDTPGARDPTFRERLVLDHLFFDLPPAWMTVTRVVQDRYGSNHHPVLGLVLR